MHIMFHENSLIVHLFSFPVINSPHHFEHFHPRAKLKLPHLRSRSRLSPSFFRTNEKTSEIYFTSPRQPPFRITRKSVPRFVRGGRSSNQLDAAFPFSATLPVDSSLNGTIRSIKQLPGEIIGIIYAGFGVRYTTARGGSQGCYRKKGDISCV